MGGGRVSGKRTCPGPGLAMGAEPGVFGELKADPGGWCRVGEYTTSQAWRGRGQGGGAGVGWRAVQVRLPGLCGRGEKFAFPSRSE